MMNFLVKFFKALFFLGFSLGLLQAQIQTQLEPQQILIGDTASLAITITTDARHQVNLPQVGDSLNDYLLITKTDTDTLQRGNNLNLIHRLTLTGFDSGKFIVNSLPIAINGDTIYSETQYLEIIDIPVDTIHQQIYPIKPIFDENITWWEKNKKYLWYMVFGGIILLVILLVIILYLRELRRKRYNDNIILSPYEEAMLALDKLDQQQYLRNENFYAYYSDLSFIIRQYFARRYEFEALALLKEDLPAYMFYQELISQEESKKLKQFLADADQVKFAKKSIEIEKSENYREWIEKIIHHTRPIVEEKVPDHI